MGKTKQIEVQGAIINLSLAKDSEYISITDMANAIDGSGRTTDIIKNWIRAGFPGTWRQYYNPHFKGAGFSHFKNRQMDYKFTNFGIFRSE